MIQDLKELKSIFEQHANPERASAMEAYMKNHFPFYGLAKEQRNVYSKTWLQKVRTLSRSEQWNLIRGLWKEPEREMQYIAMELLKTTLRHPEIEDIKRLEELILSKSWWDSVDFLAPRGIGVCFLAFPEARDETIERYLLADSMWLKRSTLIFQLFYKERTDQDLLFYLCSELSSEKDFFIRKAIGWALRQYARTNPAAVWNFVHSSSLSALSKKEATKHLKSFT